MSIVEGGGDGEFRGRPIVADLATVSVARVLVGAPNYRPLNTALSMKWVGMNTSNGYASISSTRYIEPGTHV